MYQNPSVYLNGTAPLNVTGCVQPCVYALNASTARPTSCTIVNGTARDSYLWYVWYLRIKMSTSNVATTRYDELHPSEQADRIVAREMAAVIDGQGSKWATWIS